MTRTKIVEAKSVTTCKHHAHFTRDRPNSYNFVIRLLCGRCHWHSAIDTDFDSYFVSLPQDPPKAQAIIKIQEQQ